MCSRKMVLNQAGVKLLSRIKIDLYCSTAGLYQATGIVLDDLIVLRHLFFANSIFDFSINYY